MGAMPRPPPLDRVELAGRHVRLDPLSPDHVEPLLRVASGPRATFALTLVPDSLPAMQAYVDTLLSDHARGEGLPFVVRDADGEVVGATRFLAVEWWSWAPNPPPEPVPLGPDVVEIGGTWYAERAQRTALNTEAKLLLCTHAFETLGVRRVSWKTDARNTRSRAAIERLGARFDGVLRAHRSGFDGAVRDTAFYSMLAAEWGVAKAALVARLDAPPPLIRR